MSGLPEHCPASADAVTPDSARDIGAPTVIFQSDTIDAGMAGPGRENLLSGLRRRPGKSPCKVFRSPSSSQWRPSSRILRHWMYRPKEGLSVPGAFHDPFILTAFGRRYARSVCGCFCVPGIVAFSCVVERRHSLAGANPARQLSLHHLSHERESPPQQHITAGKTALSISGSPAERPPIHRTPLALWAPVRRPG